MHPVLAERSYFVVPDSKRSASEKTYLLFASILNETKKIAIGKVMFKDKEHVIALRTYQRSMVLHISHHLDQIHAIDEVEEINHLQKWKADNQEFSLGKLTRENLPNDHFGLSEPSDSFSSELERLTEVNSKGKTCYQSPEAEIESPKNLLYAIKTSLQNSKKSKDE